MIAKANGTVGEVACWIEEVRRHMLIAGRQYHCVLSDMCPAESLSLTADVD